MLENRSFDCMLGRLYPKSSNFEGLDGTESNPWHRRDGSVAQISVWNSPEIRPHSACIPDPDPGELFSDMQMQLYGLDAPPGAEPNMSGFVDNYMRQPRNGSARNPRAVMHYFTPAQVPVLSSLARSFGVCDQWHASAPCETWPNRFFAHCGTAGGYVDNQRAHFPHRRPCRLPTIFSRLGARGHSWRIYFHDVPQSITLMDLWPSVPRRFCLFEAEFGRHVRSGRLPNYSFIEPRYYPNFFSNKLPSDQHPPHNMLYGEQLIAQVYNILRSAPSWERTLLLIIYDEHGGCFDHVRPPPAVPPGGACPDGFRFDRYGVRVPAVIVSPYVPPGSVIRPPARQDGTPSPPFEHASIQATLNALFDLGPPLTPRVAAVPNLLSALTLEGPSNLGPDHVEFGMGEPSFDEIKKHVLKRRNEMQYSMLGLATAVPALTVQAFAQLRRLGTRLTPEDWHETTPASL